MVHGMGEEIKNHREFFEFISKQDYTTFVEIGVFEGVTLKQLSDLLIKNNKNKFRVYGIDLFENTDDIIMIKRYGKERIASMYETCINKIKMNRHFINLCKADSKKASISFENESIDFAYIDASHTFENILRDLVGWYPTIKKGGIISGHDYTWDGVRKAVERFFGVGYKTTTNKEIWYHKKEIKNG